MRRRSLHLRPTHHPLLPRIKPLLLALEVEHPQDVGCALRIPLHIGMPLSAVRAAEDIANAKWMHSKRITFVCDNLGPEALGVRGFES